jgi:glutamyl-tRNA reductase
MVGANHKSASLSLRDALFVDDETAGGFLDGLKHRGLADCLVLSTCDRVEVWADAFDIAQGAHWITDALAAKAGLAPGQLAPHLYTLAGEAAVRHGFTVAASLDSLVIGEPHVVGQVKAAHRLAKDAGTMSGGLDAYVQAALAVAKRVRTETSIGEGPVSIAAAAVQTARDLHGDLARVKGLLVGTGEMGELVAESLLAAGLSDLTVTAPRAGRAEALAKSLGCHTMLFEDLRPRLFEADVVLTCLGARTVTIGADMVTDALKKRRRRPVFLVDAGIPGDVEPSVNRIDGAFLYDLGDLERVALAGRATRETAARAARELVEAETALYLKGRAARAAVPAIVALRTRFEEARGAALAECGDNAEAATRLLINRLLHAPTETLKDAAAQGAHWQELERALATLFKLEDKSS